MPADLRDDHSHHDILSTRIALSGRVWDIRDDELAYGPSTLTREYVDHRGAVAVLALDPDSRVLLLRQYRHPIRSREWELPAGILDVPGEPPVDTARRELAEEAGLAADRWHLLLDFFPSPGGSNEAIRVFLAQGVHPITSHFEPTAEEVDLEQRWVPLGEVADAVLGGRLQNGTLGIAVLAAVASGASGWRTLRDPEAPWERHPSRGAHS